jgi:hypothetical protein
MTQDEAELAETKEFLATVTASVESLRIYPRLNVDLDRVMLTLLLRCVRTAKSVCILAEQRLGDEAFILSRTVLELCFNTYFIANKDSEGRAERYMEYFGREREHLVKLMTKYQASVDSFSPDHERLLEMAKQFKSTHSWGAGGGISAMAREKPQWNDGEPPPPTEYWYDVIYRSLSHVCHGTCVGAYSDLLEIKYSHNGCYDPFKFWESKDSEWNALKGVLNAFIFTAGCVRYALHGLGISVPADIRSKKAAVEAVFERRANLSRYSASSSDKAPGCRE